MPDIGIPSAAGIQGAVQSYGVGAVGGIIYQLAGGVIGNMLGTSGMSPLIGGIAAAALAGSVVKGPRGDMISTAAGFQTGLTILGQLPATNGRRRGNGNGNGPVVAVI